MPCFFLAAEGWVGEDDVDPPVLADFGQPMAEGVAGVDARRIEAVQKQVQLGEQVGQGLGLLAEDAALLDRRPVGLGPCLAHEVVEGLGQEPPGSTGRIEHGFAQSRVVHLHHEADHRSWRIELAGVAGRVAHLPEQGFVEPPERVDFLRNMEPNGRRPG